MKLYARLIEGFFSFNVRIVLTFSPSAFEQCIEGIRFLLYFFTNILVIGYKLNFQSFVSMSTLIRFIISISWKTNRNFEIAALLQHNHTVHEGVEAKTYRFKTA